MLDSILKQELLAQSSICAASHLFSSYLTRVIPPQYDATDVIQAASLLYTHATQESNSSMVHPALRGLMDPYARQALSDFEGKIRNVATRDEAFRVEYNRQRSTMHLCPDFARVFPAEYRAPIRLVPEKKDEISDATDAPRVAA